MKIIILLSLIFCFEAKATEMVEIPVEILNEVTEKLDNFSVVFTECRSQFNSKRSIYCSNFKSQGPMTPLFNQYIEDLKPIKSEIHKIMSCGDQSVSQIDSWEDALKNNAYELVKDCIKNPRPQVDEAMPWSDNDIDNLIEERRRVLISLDNSDVDKLSKEDLHVIMSSIGEGFNGLSDFQFNFDSNSLIRDTSLENDQDIKDSIDNWAKLRQDVATLSESTINASVSTLIIGMLPYVNSAPPELLINGVTEDIKQILQLDIDELPRESKSLIENFIIDLKENNGFNVVFAYNKMMYSQSPKPANRVNHVQPILPQVVVNDEDFKIITLSNSKHLPRPEPAIDNERVEFFGKSLSTSSYGEKLIAESLNHPKLKSDLRSLLGNDIKSLEDLKKSSIPENEISIDKSFCPNISNQCESQYQQNLDKYAEAIYTAGFYDNEDNKKRVTSLYDAAKEVTKKFVEKSKISSNSKNVLKVHINGLKYGFPRTSLNELKKNIKTREKVFKWIQERNPTLPAGAISYYSNSALMNNDTLKNTMASSVLTHSGCNAFYHSGDQSLNINVGFASKYAQENHKAKIQHITLHEMGHAIDPFFNNNLKEGFSPKSSEQYKELFSCIEEKAQFNHRKNEDYADLMANEMFFSIIANSKKGDSYYIDALDKRMLLKDNLSNSCQKLTTITDTHSPLQQREDQFFSHPLFENAYPGTDNLNIDHGRDCGQIIR